MADFVKLYPDDFAKTAKILFDLADHIDHVATDTDAGFALRIPTYLYDRYETYLSLDGQSTPDAGNVEEVAPKKRGRPRKIRSGEEG